MCIKNVPQKRKERKKNNNRYFVSFILDQKMRLTGEYHVQRRELKPSLRIYYAQLNKHLHFEKNGRECVTYLKQRRKNFFSRLSTNCCNSFRCSSRRHKKSTVFSFVVLKSLLLFSLF